MKAFLTFVDNFDTPSQWPTWYRRIFLMGLPITFPLWTFAMIVLGFTLFVGLVLFTISAKIYFFGYRMWTGKMHKDDVDYFYDQE